MNAPGNTSSFAALSGAGADAGEPATSSAVRVPGNVSRNRQRFRLVLLQRERTGHEIASFTTVWIQSDGLYRNGEAVRRNCSGGLLSAATAAKVNCCSTPSVSAC
jgi:hypothetical protein